MKREKIIVGLSGGVDSSVVAALLIEQGYEVEGLFMRNWDSMTNNDFLGNKYQQELNMCPQEQDYNDALLVAEKLNIKLHRIDFVKEYWDEVFKYFIDEYQKGRTPNPDILCNKYIKFDKFLNYAITKLNANKIAMGHYAKLEYNANTKQFELKKPVDRNKDQTYFLSQLTQQQLAKVLFPLANLKKSAVRKIAEKYQLITAQKKDSTGICFIGERQFMQFLQNYIPNQPGKIIDIHTNTVVGEHIGVMYYTIGQRKGLNLGGMQEPYYVAKKDIEHKILYVAKASDERFLLSHWSEIIDLNWIVDLNKYVTNINEFNCFAKFRYRQEDREVLLTKQKNGSSYKVTSKMPLKAVTLGQQAVFYLGELCLGGGTVNKVG